MTAEIARAAGPLGAAGLALLLLATRPGLRLAGLAAWALGGAGLALYLAPDGKEALLVAAGAVGVLLAAAVAFVLLRWPWLLPLAVLACVPARIPVSVGNEEASLLLPLYGVVLAAALALAYRLVRGDDRARELGPLSWPVAAYLAWSGLSLAWSDDLREGAIELLFFYLPFGLLALAIARLPWTRRWVTGLYGLLSAMALAFAAIGIYQWLTRDIFWNPKVIVGNAYAPSGYFYRVNSVFYDPSMYGRFLVIAIVASVVLVLYGARRESALFAGAAIAVIWLGLLFSFSQSSFAALIVAVLLAAAFAWRLRAGLALGLAAVVLASVGMSAPQVRHAVLADSGTSLNEATSGRIKLMAKGAGVAVDHPVAGVGLGAFRTAYAERAGLRPGREPKRGASHTTPITVAAETGLPGLVLFAWLVGAALFAAWRRVPRTFEGRASLVFGLALAAIAVHSLFYDAFFEDPTTWALLALIPSAALAVRRSEAPA